MRVSRWLSPIIIAILVAIITTCSFNSQAQLNSPLQSGFGQAIIAVNDAEAAGATANETAPLVAHLNKAVELNREASTLSANQTEKRDALLSSIIQILTNVTSQANELTLTSTQRTHMNKILTYVTGLVLAVVGTFVYALGVEFYQRYRVKRTFQMRAKAK